MSDVIAGQLTESLTTEPVVTIKTHSDDPTIRENETLINLELPNNCFTEGKVIRDRNKDGNDDIWLGSVSIVVNEDFQGKGIGTKLQNKLIQEAKKLGATRVYIKIWSLAGLKFNANFFGTENLTFHNYIDDTVNPAIEYETLLKQGPNVRVGISVKI